MLQNGLGVINVRFAGDRYCSADTIGMTEHTSSRPILGRIRAAVFCSLHRIRLVTRRRTRG